MPSDYTALKATREPAAPKHLLPEIDHSVMRTRLKATVTEGENKIDLSLDAR